MFTLPICAGVFGVLIGSFLNVVIYRLPIMLKASWQEECNELLVFNLFMPRSHCPQCKKTIAWYQNIPLLSFLLLKGVCNNCDKNISWRYPFVELLSGVMSAYVAYYFGWQLSMVAILFLSYALIVLIFIDIDQQILPDNITLPLVWTGLLLNLKSVFATPQDAIIQAYGFCLKFLR